MSVNQQKSQVRIIPTWKINSELQREAVAKCQQNARIPVSSFFWTRQIISKLQKELVAISQRR